MSDCTVATLLAETFAALGVRRMFGVPGGGSSLDIIEAGAQAGIEFVLTRTESAAVMMAAATAEVAGTLGVALMTKGPGTANAANGVAYASLDRAPVVVLTDGFSAKEEKYVTHQVFDQRAMLSPVIKGSGRLNHGGAARELRDLIEAAMTPPLGPVLIELTSEAARLRIPRETHDAAAPVNASPQSAADLAHAQQLLDDSSRPVIILGLEARATEAVAAIRRFVEALGCPVFATYKAKGVVDDRSPQYVGEFTSGAAEADCVGKSDLIVLIGLDPVELLRQPWRYNVPVIDIATSRHAVHYVKPEAGLYGPLADSLAKLAVPPRPRAWTPPEVGAFRRGVLATLQYGQCQGIGPQHVVEIAAETAGRMAAMPRITVDAGAHMFSAMAFWPCRAPCDVLISNGLATMAFAVPAAIAAALHERQRTVIAFTGDGGLLMCLGELSTAIQQSARVVIIVFNDESLSLIDIKQQQRGLPPRGVRWNRPDFAAAMRGMGGRGYRAANPVDYRAAVAEALQGEGPALIDVAVDPRGYPDQLKALRG